MTYNYWDLRKQAARIIPRMSKLPGRDGYRQKEKGRKSNYSQFNLTSGAMDRMERLLDTESINSFAEVSLRAQSCPMPFNIDLWDGLRCSHRCMYCYADYFRHSLYTSFFDNSKEIGLRWCNDEHWRAELDKLMPHRGEKVAGESSVINAVRLGIPMRLGIRFDDFLPPERRVGVSLRLLKYLAAAKYPVMVNTKSAMIGEGEYAAALAGNPARAAVHLTMISSDEDFLKRMEPGAPSFAQRVKAAADLVKAGVRVVARIEPWMMFLTDEKSQVDEYIQAMKEAGVHHITFDSYSYSANSRGIAENFYAQGWDFERMFLLSSDSQWMSSYLLGAFIQYFRDAGMECNTFDQGNVPDNNEWICCSVGDWFGEAGAGFNWGSGVTAIRYIQSQAGKPVGWKAFETWVLGKGGWLSSQLRSEVRLLWNGTGDMAWPIFWARGLVPMGHDADGVVWVFRPEEDFRRHLFENGGLL